MYRGFVIGGEWWHVKIVPPSSPVLVDRTGTLTVATTDSAARCVYVSSAIHGRFLKRVLGHEITHVIMSIYGFNDDLKRSIRKRDYVEIEEMICNIVANHGGDILRIADDLYKAINEKAA